jgi:hypothetical protein
MFIHYGRNSFVNVKLINWVAFEENGDLRFTLENETYEHTVKKWLAREFLNTFDAHTNSGLSEEYNDYIESWSD